MVALMSVGVTLAGLGAGAFFDFDLVRPPARVAMGILFTGTSLGGMIFPPVSTFLISHYGWRLALVIYGLFAFAVLSATAMALRQESPRRLRHTCGSSRIGSVSAAWELG